MKKSSRIWPTVFLVVLFVFGFAFMTPQSTQVSAVHEFSANNIQAAENVPAAPNLIASTYKKTIEVNVIRPAECGNCHQNYIDTTMSAAQSLGQNSSVLSSKTAPISEHNNGLQTTANPLNSTSSTQVQRLKQPMVASTMANSLMMAADTTSATTSAAPAPTSS